jgi:hypothetical protein
MVGNPCIRAKAQATNMPLTPAFRPGLMKEEC